MKQVPGLRYCLAIAVVLLVVLAGGTGCKEKKPLSPKAANFCQEVQAVVQRLAPPLAEPVGREDKVTVQKVLVRLFAVCAQDCEGLMDNVLVLDKDGVNIAVYPPEKVRMWQFSDYEAVKRAIGGRKPTQAVLYRKDGTSVYVVCAPLIFQGQVTGILGLVFEGAKIREKRGLKEDEFLALDLHCPTS